ncbi:MAG: hypothetical protein QOI76_945 [Frankiales bacterium]|jgi:uncharacterized membrane protein YczE|nr:hypothetical protein [Frankiales bacterium]
MTPRQLVQLVGSCVVLGFGVVLLLTAHLGSDGYSMLVNGLHLSTGVTFWLMNVLVGLAFVAATWLRGRRPGWGTAIQPVLVGVTVSAGLAAMSEPRAMWLRVVYLVAAMPVLTFGVAGYLATGTGAGPAEGLALTTEPRIPFRWSYSVLQSTATLTGWLLGATFGVGTFLVAFGIGPMVHLLMTRARWLTPAGAQESLRVRRSVKVSNGVSAPSGPPTS